MFLRHVSTLFLDPNLRPNEAEAPGLKWSRPSPRSGRIERSSRQPGCGEAKHPDSWAWLPGYGCGDAQKNHADQLGFMGGSWGYNLRTLGYSGKF